MAEHKDLDDTNMHEPKGIGSAVAGAPDVGKVVAAVGDGTSVVRRLTPADIEGGQPSNLIYVEQLSDFPAPVAGVITLAYDTEYLVTAAINLDVNRIVVGTNSSVCGLNRGYCSLTYTGVLPLFTGADGTRLSLDNLGITAATADLFSWTGAGAANAIAMEDVTVTSCVAVGTLANITGFRMTRSVITCADGIVMTGGTTNPSFIMEQSQMLMTGGTFLDITGAQLSAGRIEFSGVQYQT